MLPSRRQQHSGSVVVHSPLLKSVAAADGPGTEASPQKKTKGRNILVATLGPDNARLLSGTCAFNDRPAWNFPSPIRFVGVVTVAVLLFGLVRWGCAHTAASCSALPLWASGLSWIPFDDESAVTEPSGSAIERFDFKYHCTPNASDPYHRPRLLFDPPVLLDGTTALPADDERRLDLLVGILSACKSSETRDVVRQTWQRLDSSMHGSWRAVFIVGRCDSSEIQDEQAKYNDLLVTSPKESYYVLTRKVLDFFEYALQVNARFTLKTDDDTFVFIDRLLMELQSMSPTCLYWGSSKRGFLPAWEQIYGDKSKPLHALASPPVKWFIPAEDYRAISEIDYAPGGAYVLSYDLVKKVAGRRFEVADHLPEDATIAALIGRELVNGCKCADSRHIKDVDSFQNLRLFSLDDSKPDAQLCDQSNAVYRSITVHGLHRPELHHEILRLATSPRIKCEELKLQVRGRVYKLRPEDTRDVARFNAVWGRELDVRGATVHMESKAYSDMVHTAVPPEQEKCSACVGDRAVAYEHALSFMQDQGIEKTPYGFHLAYDQMRRNSSLPSNGRLVPMERILRSKNVPWCYKLNWAVQIAEMVADLAERQLLLCDLHVNRIYLNSTNLRAVISAGRSQWTFGSVRFHSRAWCFSDVQCQACFKTTIDDPMDWLPEATCQATTGHCKGFDGSSQATAAARTVLLPLLSNLSDNEDVEAQAKELLMKVLDAGRNRDVSHTAPDAHLAEQLSVMMKELRLRNDVSHCLDQHREEIASAVFIAGMWSMLSF